MRNTYFRVLYKNGGYYPQMLKKGLFKDRWIDLSFYFGSDDPYPHSSHELAVRVVTDDIKRAMMVNLESEDYL